MATANRSTTVASRGARNRPLVHSAVLAGEESFVFTNCTEPDVGPNMLQEVSTEGISSTLDSEYQVNLEKLRLSARALKEFSESLRTPPAMYRRDDVDEDRNTVSHSASAETRGDFSALRGKSVLESVFDFSAQVLRQPGTFARHYGHFASELLKVAGGRSALQPERGDRRFRDAVWQDNFFYRSILQGYLAWNRDVAGLIEDLEFEDERDRARAEFIFHQLSAALAPSNSPLNPVAVKRAYQTGGKSVIAGLHNLVRDLQSNQGMPRQVSADAYQVGKDLGSSDGAVVYRSELLELIQYGCAGQAQVHEQPVLIIPPQINKFYVFDLTPKNSLVDFLRRQGLQVFIVSWKNPSRAHANAGLDDYVSHLSRAVDAILEITGSTDVNLASACAGGITAVSLQALDAHQGRARIRHHSLLVTALSVEGHPTLDLFMSRSAVSTYLARSQRRGVMDGRELAHVFAWLRPTDLVWNFWINNNLLGKEPPTMDVLHWDNDSTRLPAALHRDFADILLNDRFAGNTLTLAGQSIDLANIRGHFYFLAGQDDYLMPWRNCYRNPALFANADCRFVLSNSGHIQSVLRPPGIASSTYTTNEALADTPEAWLATASKTKGSWWEDWCAWLHTRSGGMKAAPEMPGSEKYPPLCPSPGTYVLER